MSTWGHYTFFFCLILFTSAVEHTEQDPFLILTWFWLALLVVILLLPGPASAPWCNLPCGFKRILYFLSYCHDKSWKSIHSFSLQSLCMSGYVWGRLLLYVLVFCVCMQHEQHGFKGDGRKWGAAELGARWCCQRLSQYVKVGICKSVRSFFFFFNDVTNVCTRKTTTEINARLL